MAQRALQWNWFRRVVTGLVVLAMLSPVIRHADGLPLSTYPMYSGVRSDTLSLVTATGITASGDRLTLSMPVIAQTRDPLIAQSFLNDAVATGSTDMVCREIARRVGGHIRRIEISREHRDVVAHALGDSSLIGRQGLASCRVSE